MSIPDARDVAKTLRRAGWDVEEHTDAHGAPRWTATHPAAPKPCTWGPNVNKRAQVRQAGDLIGDKVLARRNMRASNKAKQGDHQLSMDRERSRSMDATRAAANLGIIERRHLRGPAPVIPADVTAVIAAGWTIEPHALERFRERGADIGNLLRAVLRPERTRRLSNGHDYRETATCKVYVDPVAHVILTVV